MTAVEERRKQQENRKFSKALKSHKAKEKTEDKKKTLEAVNQWKKDRAQRYVEGLHWIGGDEK
jgi:regulator of replication initiation timing